MLYSNHSDNTAVVVDALELEEAITSMLSHCRESAGVVSAADMRTVSFPTQPTAVGNTSKSQPSTNHLVVVLRSTLAGSCSSVLH